MKPSCAVALLVALAAVTFAQVQEKAYRLYQEANTLFVAKKFSECQQALEEALRLDPKLAPALTLKAKLAMSVNRFDIARQALEQALAVDPSSWYAHFLYGFQYHLQNDLQLALPELAKARQLNPRDARPAIYLGLTHESLGHTGEAIGFYEEAIRLEAAAGKPQADTLLTYSRLLFVLGRLEECGRLIERALGLEPNSRDVHFERGRLLMKNGDAGGAAKEGETALGLPASGIPDRQIHYLLVRAYRMSGQERLAEEHAVALRAAESKDF
jgi:tetratricopeptide (TPR) repeat protein